MENIFYSWKFSSALQTKMNQPTNWNLPLPALWPVLAGFPDQNHICLFCWFVIGTYDDVVPFYLHSGTTKIPAAILPRSPGGSRWCCQRHKSFSATSFRRKNEKGHDYLSHSFSVTHQGGGHVGSVWGQPLHLLAPQQTVPCGRRCLMGWRCPSAFQVVPAVWQHTHEENRPGSSKVSLPHLVYFPPYCIAGMSLPGRSVTSVSLLSIEVAFLQHISQLHITPWRILTRENGGLCFQPKVSISLVLSRSRVPPY